jgi:hypothetical protein
MGFNSITSLTREGANSIKVCTECPNVLIIIPASHWAVEGWSGVQNVGIYTAYND